MEAEVISIWVKWFRVQRSGLKKQLLIFLKQQAEKPLFFNPEDSSPPACFCEPHGYKSWLFER